MRIYTLAPREEGRACAAMPHHKRHINGNVYYQPPVYTICGRLHTTVREDCITLLGDAHPAFHHQEGPRPRLCWSKVRGHYRVRVRISFEPICWRLVIDQR